MSKSKGEPAPAVATPEGEAKPTRIVTHEMAREAFRKMHIGLYGGGPIPMMSIPARLDDADIVLSDYICQQKALATPPTSPVPEAGMGASVLQAASNDLLRKLSRQVFEDGINIEQLPLGVALVEDFAHFVAAHVLAQKEKR